MNHLENLIKQYYEWKGYVVRNNVKVGRLAHGGWAGELDIVAYHPRSHHLIHLEPSIDAHSWPTREQRFRKNFAAGREYIREDVFPWVDTNIPIEQVAVLVSSSKKELADSKVWSIDELVKKMKSSGTGLW